KPILLWKGESRGSSPACLRDLFGFLTERRSTVMTLTEAAATQLERVRDSANLPEQTCFRIAADNGDLNLQWDQERPGDTTLCHNGKKILVLDQDVASRLEDKTLDARHTEHGTQFIFR